MKQMEYKMMRSIDVLDKGTYRDIDYYILSMGTHPTAYLDLKNTKYNEREDLDFDLLDLNVHCGITYSERYLKISKNEEIKGWFIGWDYAHCGDKIGYNFSGKEWTTEEILNEVKDAIDELKEKMEEN